MYTTYKFERFSPSCDLSPTGIDVGLGWYRDMTNGETPTTLFVSPERLETAYQLIRDMQTWTPMICPIPGFPTLCWGIAGSRGVIISPFV